MFTKMKESKGFTLVELMIVVAIIGILAAVAVPYYQRYIQKARLTSKVFPGIHAIETNLATYYSFQNTFPTSTTAQASMSADADTVCFGNPTYAAGGDTVTIQIGSGARTCPELQALSGANTGVLTFSAMTTGGKISGWLIGGNLATNLGLAGEH